MSRFDVKNSKIDTSGWSFWRLNCPGKLERLLTSRPPPPGMSLISVMQRCYNLEMLSLRTQREPLHRVIRRDNASVRRRLGLGEPASSPSRALCLVLDASCVVSAPRLLISHVSPLNFTKSQIPPNSSFLGI
jgi:hypothetical protein